MRALFLSLALGVATLGLLAVNPSGARADENLGIYGGTYPVRYWRGGSYHYYRGGSHYYRGGSHYYYRGGSHYYYPSPTYYYPRPAPYYPSPGHYSPGYGGFTTYQYYSPGFYYRP